MDNEIALEPLKYYNEVLKQRCHENVVKLWDQLVADSRMNVDENRKLSDLYNRSVRLAARSSSKIRMLILVNIIVAALALAAFYGLYQFFEKKILDEVSGGTMFYTLVFLGIVGIGLWEYFYVVPRWKRNKNLKKEYDQKSAEAKIECAKTMEKLNSLFDEDQARLLVMKTFPELYIAPYVKGAWIRNVERQYGSFMNDTVDNSVLDAVGGSLDDAPFVIRRKLSVKIVGKEYSGAVSISWTETESYYDSSSRRYRTRLVTRHETLRAYVTEPAPVYEENLCLAYGNTAAPDLSFTRVPSHVERMDKSELQRFIKSQEKKIASLGEKSVQNAGTFTPLTNTHFDCLFHAYDRDNPVQFRMLFTPLCELSMTDLLQNSPYGDNFYFAKAKTMNYVYAEHCENWKKFVVLPKDCMDFSYENAKENFIRLHEEFFEKLFFLLAPVMAIPLYAQTKCSCFSSDLKSENYDCSNYEAELLANALSVCYTPSDAKTRIIRKAEWCSKTEDGCCFNIRMHYFHTKKRGTVIRKRGGDGHMHDIPVEWTEYIPYSSDSKLFVKKADCSERCFRNTVGEKDGTVLTHGLIGSVCEFET